jgi:Tfp pilus assembly protein PilO
MALKNLDRACLAMVVGMSLMAVYWVVNHGIQQRRQIKQENELYLKRLKDLDLAKTNLNRLKTAMEATRQELNALNERVPESAEMGKFLKQIDSLMRKEHMVLIRLQPLQAMEEKRYIKIPFRLMFTGPFMNIYQLIYELEAMNRKVVIEKLTLHKSEGSKTCEGVLTAAIFER